MGHLCVCAQPSTHTFSFLCKWRGPKKKMWTIFWFTCFESGSIAIWRSTVGRRVGMHLKYSIMFHMSMNFRYNFKHAKPLIVNIINVTDLPRGWENMINISIGKRFGDGWILPLKHVSSSVVIMWKYTFCFSFAVKCTWRWLVCMLRYEREIAMMRDH